MGARRPELLIEENRITFCRHNGIFNSGRAGIAAGPYGKIATPVHKAHRGQRIPLPQLTEGRNLIGAGQFASQVGWERSMKWGGVIGGSALAALGSLSASLTDSLPARAADMTPAVQRSAPASSYIPAQFWWTGFYMGAGIGDGWGTSTFTDPLAPGATGSPSINGFLFSGVMGINYQFSSVVVGVEGDFTGSFANGSAVDTAGHTLQTRVFWTASITGRLGWAIDRLLIYGKGGVAFDNDRDIAAFPSTASVTGTANHVGWTVGGGAEYAITEHWTARIEYDYFAFSSKAFSFSGPGAPPGTVSGGAVGINFNEIKGIVAYKF
jgi:outer membrane immunogenic protein